MHKKDFVLLTLASNNTLSIIAKDNIAFIMIINTENENKEVETFTRVFLKNISFEDETKWVDVKETPEKIYSLL